MWSPVRREVEDDPLMTTAEVAKLFRVNTKTVARWVKQRKLPVIRTPLGGVLRFRTSEVQRYYRQRG